MITALEQSAAIGFAGFLGALARYYITLLCARWLGAGFPAGTMIINLSGSFFLGWFMTFATRGMGLSPTLRLAIGTGFVGAYTTFSTWMYESHKQMEDGAFYKAAFNLVGSLVLGLIAVRLGVLWAGKSAP